MQNLNTNEMTGRGVIVLNVSEMPQENISVGKGKNYLLVGDNSVWLKKIPNNSIDSIVTDPPAGISFMARGWEYVEGVELTEEYIPIAEARIEYWLKQMNKQTEIF